MSLNRRSGRDLFSTLREAPSNPRLAFLLPGQGAQRVGMGKDACELSEASREVFSIADQAFGGRLSTICFEGPQELLTQTKNAQPAIVATSAAYVAIAIERGALRERPAYLIGHSLGEYTALVLAGALSLHEAIVLVKERGTLMSEAGVTNPGTMAALLGLGEDVVHEICNESGAEPANFNGPTQTVVGGTVEAVEKAASLTKARGGKVLSVKVSGAFHTSLMSDAARDFSERIAGARIADPVITVLGNVTATPLLSSEQIKEELSQQVARPVQWSRSIDYVLNEGVDTFVEIGPGRTLTGMLKRIAPEAKSLCVDSVEALSEALSV